MNSVFEILLCICVIAVTAGKCLAQMDSYSDSDGSDGRMADINKKGWSMLRLGRGLQMLRLGKRSADYSLLKQSQPGSDSDNKLSPSDVQAVLDSIFDSPRDESRRQPPLPRYGKRSRPTISNTRDILDTISTDESGSLPLDFLPMANTRLFFRPAPRGGRYKRSVPADLQTYGDFINVEVPRTVPLPRFGRFFEEASRTQAKAVPLPRFGKQIDDSSKTVSQ